jgi:membrane-associated phospholipid phosphatase
VTKLIKDNLYFLVPYIIVLITALVYLLIDEKTEIHIFFNRYHSPFADHFFRLYTHTGNGLFAIVFTLSLLFVKYRYAIIAGISSLLTGLLVQFLKMAIFTDSYRPILYFERFYKGDAVLHIPGNELPGLYYSFPSGHAATAFIIFLIAAIIVKKRYLNLFLFIGACISAYSRVYLSWHFLGDIVTGSLIGVILTLSIFWYIDRIKSETLDKSLI